MKKSSAVTTTVLVSALGYFVDIYDLILFSIVRMTSLRSLGVPEDQLLEQGVRLLNMQMIGMLVGGLLWGVLGDKKGRVSVLFGSIFMYSVANILNGFVTTVDQYALLRFIAGVGLAGELGAAITLVSETMSREKRGYGTTIVAAVGLLGAVLAAFIGEAFAWQTAYIIGGVMGLALLVLRISVYESGMYESIKSHATASKGDLRLLFKSKRNFVTYVSCILIGVPVWFVIGILVTFSPEISRELEVTGPIVAGSSVMWSYIGLSLGDVASGLLSQKLRSRRKVLIGFFTLTGLSTLVYVFSRGLSPAGFYALCTLLGFSVGYWAMFVTVASEQFGTNLRATVTTTAPNFVRGSVVPLTLGFASLKQTLPLATSALIVGAVSLLIAFIAVSCLEETFGKDLDYVEEVA